MPAKSRKSTKKPAKSTPRIAESKAPSAPAPTPPPALGTSAPIKLAPGTVLKKLDRAGDVRCECTVEAGGFRYDGKLYPSISAAAAAAAKVIGRAGSSFNGNVFWGVAKPSRRDLAHRLDHLWQRYTSTATALLNTDGAEKAASVERLREHLAEFKALV